MYERFTAEARDAIMGAQLEARALAHDYIGTEHLLLGLLRLPARGDARLGEPEPAGIGQEVLAVLGLTLDRARVEVEAVVGRGGQGFTDADAEALRSIGIDVDEIRRRVEETFGPGALDVPMVSGGMGPVFTSRAKQVMAGALREALMLGHGHIGGEHLLLALAASEGSRPRSSGASAPIRR